MNDQQTEDGVIKMSSKRNEIDSIVEFKGDSIRRIWYNERWFFSVVDVVSALTESVNPRDYWYRLKSREKETSGIELSTICRQLKLMAGDGKRYLTDCSDTEGILRIIQSIPSKKAEPFKRWLARTGYERIREIEDPELAQHRIISIYRAKGYSDEWIEKRIRSMAIRGELTEEWKMREVEGEVEYAILTSDISRGTFGLTPSEYRSLKGLKKENLRDHMNDLELIFTMLGESVTTEITRAKDRRGFDECEDAALEGGEVAGNARKDTEKRTGRSVISDDNYLKVPEKKKRLKKRNS